jgi:hypothetical protein
MPFDAWWYLRFLLPAYPVLAVATCMTVAAVAGRLRLAGPVLATALVGGAVAFGLYYSADFEALGEYRFPIMGAYVRDRLPHDAVVFSMMHGGSTMLYSGRPIVRWDFTDRARLDEAISAVESAGYHPYAVLDDWEVKSFRDLFAGRSQRGALDWPPLVMLQHVNTGVWDLSEDREAARKRPIEQLAWPH